MTDHWEFFPCQMGKNIAFIFYDHGIRESIDSFKQDRQVRFDVTLKAPNDRGLPANEELDLLESVESKIEKFAQANDGIYVGRVTTAGPENTF